MCRNPFGHQKLSGVRSPSHHSLSISIYGGMIYNLSENTAKEVRVIREIRRPAPNPNLGAQNDEGGPDKETAILLTYVSLPHRNLQRVVTPSQPAAAAHTAESRRSGNTESPAAYRSGPSPKTVSSCPYPTP